MIAFSAPRREVPAIAARGDYDIVIPTVGRSSLRTLLMDLALCEGPPPTRVILVDDRPDKRPALLPAPVPSEISGLLRVLPGKSHGPAAARNLGWQAGSASWVVFLDDDVRPAPDWYQQLAIDLASAAPDVGGVQGQIRVPLPLHRLPTDWERNVQGLERAQWATADMAYRRCALERVGGFDERFQRAYREDADLGLRVTDAGFRIERGDRHIDHPVRDADSWISVHLQRGNADDVFMRALHGPRWRARAGAPPGARNQHLFTTTMAATALVSAAAGLAPVALGAAGAWALCTASFAYKRIAPGPRTTNEVLTMCATSVVLPVAATWHWLRGVGAALSSSTEPQLAPPKQLEARPIRAVLLDRDGTLVEDVPYNGDPSQVVPRPGAREALDRLREAGLPLLVISNQSGIGRGLVSEDEVCAVNARIEALLGPFDAWFYCPHAPGEGCLCRKPAPAMVYEAATHAGVAPEECVVLGDIGSDMDAARAAGARGVLVPTQATREEEIWAAEELAADLMAAADRVLRRVKPS
jgi:HAD superfamily hydrolase (TIGR01662 family)